MSSISIYMWDNLVEFVSVFKYKIKVFLLVNLFIKPYSSRVFTRLPQKLPDKDNKLKLVGYSSIVDTAREVNAYLTNTFPKDEGIMYKILYYLKKGDRSVPINTDYRLYNGYDVEKVFYKDIDIYINKNHNFIDDVLNESECIQNGEFFGSFTKEDCYFVIDSLFMVKYSYKKDVLIPAVKAYFILGSDDKMKLEKILYKDEIYYSDSDGFKLAKRVLYNYLLIRNIIYYHLVISHLKITQKCAYAIRKYLSSNNILKQFLWNFTLGVHGINYITGSLIKKKYGNLCYCMPFTDSGLIDYINDNINEDCSEYIFPRQKYYPSKVFEESEIIFETYNKYVSKITNRLNKSDFEECEEMCDYLRMNINEFRDKDMEMILSSFMYVSSVFHDTTAKLGDQMIRGYDCPISINNDGTIDKYKYIVLIFTEIFVNIPQRRVCINLPESYNSYIRKQYSDMCNELLEKKFEKLDICNIDSCVQK